MKRISTSTRAALAAGTAVAIVLTGLVSTSAHAAPPAVSATIADSVAQLDWEPLPSAEAYMLVDDRSGEVLWRGTETAAELPIQAPISTATILAGLVDDDWEDMARILATAPGGVALLTPFVAVTTPSGTSLSWGAIPNADTYEASGTDTETTTTRATTVNLPAKLGDTARYEMRTEVPPPLAAPNSTVVGDYLYGADIRPVSIRTSSASPGIQEGDTVAAGITTITASRTEYETYIPDAYIDAPERGSFIDCERGNNGEDWWYSADNRGTAYGSGKFRTAARVEFFWTSRANGVTSNVSSTSRFRRNANGTFTFDSTRRAGSEGLIIRPLQNDGRYGRAVIEHNISNPYCTPIADITYDSQQDLYQNGGHYIYGSHDRMPNHQMYRLDRRSDGSTNLALIFDHPLQDPGCLAGALQGCSSRQYQYVR